MKYSGTKANLPLLHNAAFHSSQLETTDPCVNLDTNRSNFELLRSHLMTENQIAIRNDSNRGIMSRIPFGVQKPNHAAQLHIHIITIIGRSQRIRIATNNDHSHPNTLLFPKTTSHTSTTNSNHTSQTNTPK